MPVSPWRASDSGHTRRAAAATVARLPCEQLFRGATDVLDEPGVNLNELPSHLSQRKVSFRGDRMGQAVPLAPWRRGRGDRDPPALRAGGLRSQRVDRALSRNGRREAVDAAASPDEGQACTGG